SCWQPASTSRTRAFPSRVSGSEPLTRAGHRVDHVWETVRRTRERQNSGRDPRLAELGKPLALGLGRPQQEYVPDEAPGDERARPRAVPRVPRLEDGLELGAEAEPAKVLGVDRHDRVPDQHALRDRDRLGFWALEREEAARELLVRCPEGIHHLP